MFWVSKVYVRDMPITSDRAVLVAKWTCLTIKRRVSAARAVAKPARAGLKYNCPRPLSVHLCETGMTGEPASAHR